MRVPMTLIWSYGNLTPLLVVQLPELELRRRIRRLEDAGRVRRLW